MEEIKTEIEKERVQMLGEIKELREMVKVLREHIGLEKDTIRKNMPHGSVKILTSKDWYRFRICQKSNGHKQN